LDVVSDAIYSFIVKQAQSVEYAHSTCQFVRYASNQQAQCRRKFAIDNQKETYGEIATAKFAFAKCSVDSVLYEQEEYQTSTQTAFVHVRK